MPGLNLWPLNTHTHTYYMHTHIHRHPHTHYMYTHTLYAHTQRCIQVWTPTQACTYTICITDTHRHAHTHKETNTGMNTYTGMHIHYMHHVHTYCMHTHYMHTWTHTYSTHANKWRHNLHFSFSHDCLVQDSKRFVRPSESGILACLLW